MKSLLKLSPILLATTALNAQELVGSAEFFNPDFQARRPGTGGLLSLTVNNDLFTPASQTSGNMTWSHSAGGFVEVGVNVVLASANAQLAAYTRTTGDTLVFGREIVASGAVSLLDGVLNQAAGASVLYNWESTGTLTGLAIVPDQLYQVSFSVTSASGLPVNLLTAANFGITNPSITGAGNESAQLLNLLDLITVGADSSTGEFSFVFQSAEELDSLEFFFEASSGVGVSLLGGTEANQEVLTFSNFSLQQIPEPSTAALLGLASLGLMLRRRVK